MIATCCPNKVDLIHNQTQGVEMRALMDRIYFGNAKNVGRKLKALGSATSPRVNVLDYSADASVRISARSECFVGEMRVVSASHAKRLRVSGFVQTAPPETMSD